MTTATVGTIERMRTLVAFALTVCEREGAPLWSIEVLNDARDLRVFIDLTEELPDPVGCADRLAVALGVDPAWQVTRHQPGLYTVGSRAPREVWHREDYPVYFGESVPFDGRLIEVAVTVSVPKDEDEAP